MAVSRLLIDGDGCPVVGEAVELARRHGWSSLIFCDTAHQLALAGAETITVSKGRDSADFALVNRVTAGDVVVTQDYGLAAMCLAKGAVVLNQDGQDYTPENMDALLYTRYLNQKARRAGGRCKGPSKRRAAQTAQFCRRLAQVLEEKQG